MEKQCKCCICKGANFDKNVCEYGGIICNHMNNFKVTGCDKFVLDPESVEEYPIDETNNIQQIPVAVLDNYKSYSGGY